MKCYFCGCDETVGGAWVDRKNPCHFPDRDLIIKARTGEPNGHALCMLLESKGFAIIDGKLKKVGIEYEML